MEYQIEALRKHGLNNPETGLLRKVKRIHFSQKIEIRDPGVRQIDKKDAKNFMVNQTSILLERDQIVLSPFDDMVWKQMQDYQVIRRKQNGEPVYTSENEHALDAFMLTILGFTVEFPDITKILEKIEPARKTYVSQQKQVENLREKAFGGDNSVFRKKKRRKLEARDNPNWNMEKVSLGYTKSRTSGWAKRASSRGGVYKRTKL